jgi:hypothetical protein
MLWRGGKAVRPDVRRAGELNECGLNLRRARGRDHRATGGVRGVSEKVGLSQPKGAEGRVASA